MPALEPGKIRNVAVVGHRGTGKTSLVEALLYQSGAVNRLGTVEQGTTVSDWDEDENRRQMSLSASLCHCEWQDRKINLIDAPGDAGFQGDTIAALRVVEGELVVVSGVMGVEVGTGRTWHRGEDGHVARVVVVNMLDRERADFFRSLEAVRSQLSPNCVAVHIPIGAEHELTGIVDVLHMCAYTSPEGAREGARTEIPAEMADQAAEYREKLLDAVVETDEGLMERYLDGQELSDEEVATALKEAVTRGEVFPVAAAVATKNLGHDGAPRPARRGRAQPGQEGRPGRDRGRVHRSVRLQDDRRPVRRPDQRLPRPQGDGDDRHDPDQHARALEGAHGLAARAPGQGAHADRRVRRGRHRRGRQAEGRHDRRSPARQGGRSRAAALRLPRAGDELRDHPEGKG